MVSDAVLERAEGGKGFRSRDSVVVADVAG